MEFGKFRRDLLIDNYQLEDKMKERDEEEKLPIAKVVGKVPLSNLVGAPKPKRFAPHENTSRKTGGAKPTR